MPLLRPMTVSGPFGQYTSDAIVDPGSTFASIPAPALIEMGIEPTRVARMRDADGRLRFYQLGRALVTIDGHEEVMPVLFGDAGGPSVIGFLALALLLLNVDVEGAGLEVTEEWPQTQFA